jgi:DNA-directed RNA polymerase specialized sigma24 family protein
VTPAMRAALIGGAVVFALGALVQVVAALWLVAVTAITGVAGSILAHTGGLEPKTFATCVVVAIVLDAALLLAIVIASIRRRSHRDAAAEPAGASRGLVARTAAGLLVALLAVTAAGWKHSAYFPYPLATIVVLANTYFFALLSLLYTARAVDKTWKASRAWAQTTPYRTGLLTATLVLLGLAGFALRKTELGGEPVRRLIAHIHPDQVPALSGFADGQLAALCIAAEEIAPELARGASAPGCRFLGNAEGSIAGLLGPGTDCFTTLEPELDPAKSILKYRLGLSRDDADDIATDALLKTCTREPLPDNLRAYFFQVVRNRGMHAVIFARRILPCPNMDDQVPVDCSGDPPEYREAELALVWEYARCVLNDLEANVLQSRLVDELPFRQIGEQWGLGEAKARYTFHNAVGKLQRRLGSCLR